MLPLSLGTYCSQRVPFATRTASLSARFQTTTWRQLPLLVHAGSPLGTLSMGFLSDRKLAVLVIRHGLSLSSPILFSKCDSERWSKAPLTSISSVVAIFPMFQVSCTFWIRMATASVADLRTRTSSAPFVGVVVLHTSSTSLLPHPLLQDFRKAVEKAYDPVCLDIAIVGLSGLLEDHLLASFPCLWVYPCPNACLYELYHLVAIQLPNKPDRVESKSVWAWCFLH